MQMVITKNDIISYIILNRRKGELRFKKQFLLRNGITPEDYAVKALADALTETESELTIIEKKIDMAGIEPIVLHKKEIEELNTIIKEYTTEDIITAARTKQGKLYELLKRRSELSKDNLERKEEIAQLTLLLTTMPLEIADKIKTFVESDGTSSDTLDLHGVSENKIEDIVKLLNRLGIGVRRKDDDRFVLIKDENAAEREVARFINGRKVWIDAGSADELDRLNREIESVTNRIQAFTMKKQIRPLTEEELGNFAELQKRYVELVTKREELIKTKAD
ncbi:hypothetical protein J7K41_00300 [Candidatus Micrarchaeota archaeon]|nr:hypothetical protein [Candidatus Micrarchaeota archaeon]